MCNTELQRKKDDESHLGRELNKEFAKEMMDDSKNVPEKGELPKLEGTGMYPDTSPTLLDKIRIRYNQDNVFSKVVDHPSQFINFQLNYGLLYFTERIGKAICIPDVEVEGWRVHEIVVKETHELLKHAATCKIISGMRGQVWWDSMIKYTKEYCTACSICTTLKDCMQSKCELLRSLKITEELWECISIDFMGPLSESENLYNKWDMVCVVTDYVTGMIRIIPTKQG